MRASDHGGDILFFSKRTKKKITDFSSNINCVKPNINIKSLKIDISPYPDFRYTKLKKVVSRKYNLKFKNIFLSKGATDAINHLLKTINFKKATLYAPLYGEYKKSLKTSKIKIINRLSKSFSHVEKPLKNSLVIFVNPSTPDGKYYDLKKYIKMWKKLNCTVIIDESFLDFSEKRSAVTYLKKYKKLYIIKSFTKFYSCAGVRIGAVFSHHKNIKNLQKNYPLWSISSFDEKYLIKALKDKKLYEKSLKKTKRNKKYLKKVLEKSKLFSKIYPSNANYLLCRLKRQNAKKLQKKLLKKGILIRNCENFDFLNDKYVRFAVKCKKDIKKLKKAILA